MRQKQFELHCVGSIGRREQRRPSCHILRIHRGAGPEQCFGHARVVAHHGKHQRRAAMRVARIGIGVLRQQPLHCAQIVIFHRGKQRRCDFLFDG